MPEGTEALVAQGGAPGGAAPYVTGRARLALSAARGEANLVSWVRRLRILAPPAAPPPRAVREGLANLGRNCAARTRSHARHSGALAPFAQANPESRGLTQRFNTSGFRVRAKRRAPE